MNTDMIDHFCTRFAAGAGTAFHWELSSRGNIRAHAAMGCFCPISAEANLEYGKTLSAGSVDIAAELLGLNRHTRNVIMYAADNVDTELRGVPAIRQRLLTICGLKEPTP